MISLLIILLIGVLNAAVAYDQEILMLRNYPREIESWIEALLFIVLWPLQLVWWIGMKVWSMMDWCQAKIWGA